VELASWGECRRQNSLESGAIRRFDPKAVIVMRKVGVDKPLAAVLYSFH
jgi:hypothetical protein